MDISGRYDFLIVGSGIYGAAAARVLADGGCRVLVVEKRDHIGGNAYTEYIDGICVHMYGPHIFHTDSERVWEFVNRFARFNNFINEPLANWRGELYPLPFNMNTFRKMWGTEDPDEARRMIREQIRKAGIGAPANLEEQAISMVGTDIYEKLISGYTEKQWGRKCSELPASIIRRVPVRYEYNNNYYSDRYQGIPEGGYTEMIGAMLRGIDVITGTDHLERGNRKILDAAADKVIFTGQIDAYYDYCYGPLEYRGLRFETEMIDLSGPGRSSSEDAYKDPEGRIYFQPRAVVNYTDRETPWTRIIEHRHFTESVSCESQGMREGRQMTVITREYPVEWKTGDEAFYPIDDRSNREKYDRYLSLASDDEHVIFGGRLGSYRYYDMDDAVLAAMDMAEALLSR